MVVTTIIALYLTRIVLEYMGKNDFGIYSLIGGIISLLSFISSALSMSTQRFLSVEFGRRDFNNIKNVLSTSIQIHVGLVGVVIVLFELCGLFIFDGFLNIDPSRITAAKIVFQLMIISTAFTIMGAPYNAVMNAREDLWAFSIIETICAIFKLGILIVYHFYAKNALITYTAWIVGITVINFFIKSIWCKLKYDECKGIKLTSRNKKTLIKELLGFSGWNAFGTLSTVGRNQGIAVVLNLFWGTAINAVYGIANQVNSQLIYFSTMMTSSMTPQIMKSYGEGNINRMLYLAVFTCKMSFLLSAIFAIPLLIEMDYVLKIWLKNVPEHTYQFCSLIIYMFLIMQMSPGLNRAIQASGKIRLYQVITSIILLLPVPLGYKIAKETFSYTSILYLMILSQAVQLIVNIIMANKLVKLHIMPFIRFILSSTLVFGAVLYIGNLLAIWLGTLTSEFWELIIIICTTMTLFFLSYYIFVFGKSDKERIKTVFKNLIKR